MKRQLLFITLCSFLLLLNAVRSGAQNTEPRVTILAKNQPLREIFRTIQSQTGLNIVVSEKIISGAQKVTLNVKDMPLNQVLNLCFRGTDLTGSIVDGIIVVKKKEATEANLSATIPGESLNEFVRGTVTNTNHQPLDGASVQVKDKNISAITGRNGQFNIKAGAHDQLIFSYVNYKQQTVPVKGRAVVDVVLEPNLNPMAEVTISTGYQKIEQNYLTGSVTSLRMDSMKQPGIATVDRMLEGRVPGLIFMQNSGQPGVAPKLRIRGTSTILGTREPLWVVDGMVQTDPVPVDPQNINNLDFVNLVGNAIAGLNPNDIEQIDVLKDAAATALYGVRAANGVIVITTKRGKPGPPTVTYSASGTYTRRPRYTDRAVHMMNSLERVDVSRELIEKKQRIPRPFEAYEKALVDYYDGNIDFDTYQQLVGQAESMNTDWFKVLTRDVFASNHSLRIAGGTQSNRYYASVGYTDEQGVIKSEYNKRYTAQIKFDVYYKKFKAQFGIIANKNDRHYVPSDISVLNHAYNTSRAIPLYNTDGSLYYYPKSSEEPKFNVLNEIGHSGNTIDLNTYTATANLNYQVIPDLQLETLLSYTAANTEQRTWFEGNTDWVYSKKGNGDPNLDEIPIGGELRQGSNRQRAFNIRGQANYSRFVDAGKKHLIQATLGGELSSNQNSGFQQINRGYYPDRGYSFAVIDLDKYPAYKKWLTRDPPNGGKAVISESLTNLASGYITANYIYDDRYVLSANTRTDFSNAFGDRSNEKFLPTWSLSGRWNLHKDVLKGLMWVNEAALRVSWGTQGNMLPNQTPYTIITKGNMNANYKSFMSTISNFPNPNLKWERTNSYNAALDFSLFNNRLRGSVGFFYKRTENAFITKQLASVNGIEEYVVNGGTLENQGVELSFNFTPINTMSKDNKGGFYWRVDPQLGQVFNKLMNAALGSNKEAVIGGVRGGILSKGKITFLDYLNGQVNINGKPVNSFYAYRFKGLDHTTGQPTFYGAELDNAAALAKLYSTMKGSEILQAVLVPVGRREPVLQGGISNDIGYRNWSLNFMFTYSIGNKVRLLRIMSNYGTNSPSSQQNMRKEFVDRWRYPGDEEKTNIPGVSGFGTDKTPWWSTGAFGNIPTKIGDSYYQMYDDADIRVVSGDYVKLQSVNFNYHFNRELCKKLRAKAATISLGGSNLFTLAHRSLRGQDPSQSGSSPNINLSIRPVYSFNINVNF